MNIQKLNLAISEFSKKRKTNAAYYDENWTERKERKDIINLLPKRRFTL